MPRRRLILLPKFFLPTTGGLQNATVRIGKSLADRGWRVSAQFAAAPADRPAPTGSRSSFDAVAHEGSRASFWSRIPEIVDGDLDDTAVLAVGLEYEEDLGARARALCKERVRRALGRLHHRGARVVLRIATSHDIADRITQARARSLAEIDWIVVLNEQMEAEAARWPALNGKVHRIPVMVDIVRYRPDQTLRRSTRDRFGIDAARAVVLCAGRLDERKRASLVVDAMRGVDALLWFVGDAPDSQSGAVERLRQHASELGVQNIRVDPGVPEDEMPGLLAAVDVFVTASAVEGMSNAVLEAASCGLAVAGYAIPGIEETAEALAGAGFHLAGPATGAAGLRAALGEALANLPDAGWRAAREVGLGRFSIPTVSAQWNALLGGTP
jgi:glycosyltransferase involved in cell wall biosynthesis